MTQFLEGRVEEQTTATTSARAKAKCGDPTTALLTMMP
jgi:hypothetical protein